MCDIYDQIFLFGDSLTQFASCQSSNEHGFGFAPALQEAYIRRLDVINRGFSGYNTRNALAVLPKIMPAPNQASIRFMTIFFGSNDACRADSPTGQHVPLHEYSENLRKIVRFPAVQSHNLRLIIITNALVNEHAKAVLDRQNGYDLLHTAEKMKAYAEAASKVGQEEKIPVLNLWSIFAAKTGWKAGEILPGSKEKPESPILKNLLFDGLHFSPEGYRIIYEELMRLIAEIWPDQTPQNLPQVFPDWKDAHGMEIMMNASAG